MDRRGTAFPGAGCAESSVPVEKERAKLVKWHRRTRGGQQRAERTARRGRAGVRAWSRRSAGRHCTGGCSSEERESWSHTVTTRRLKRIKDINVSEVNL